MPKQKLQWIVAGVFLAIAGWRLWVVLTPDSGPAEKAYFYDVSARKLFVAERGLVPPIRGVEGPEEDGVRAVVVAPPGKCDDPKAQRIAYLETNAPELKKSLEAAKAAGVVPTLSRGQAQSLRLVRRVTDAEWVSLVSPEGEQIVSEWAVPGTDGQSPAVCTP